MLTRTNRLRTMLAELRSFGLDTDEIARRAQVPRSAVYRFSQGDSHALADGFDNIVVLYSMVVHKAPPPER